MPKYLLTMTLDGRIYDKAGEMVAWLGDSSNIGDFMLGYRAGHGPVDGNIIRDGDWQAWEAAVVKRQNGKAACHAPCCN